MFIKDENGNIAIMVSLLFPVIIMASGAAIDTGYAVMLKSELTQVTKMACTRLSTSAARTASAPEQVALTGAAIETHLAKMRLDRDTTAFDFTPASNGSATVDARSIYETRFMNIFGFDTLGLAASETCSFKLRIPTGRSTTICDATAPYRSAGSSFTLTLAAARNEWVDHNETCGWVSERDGGYYDADGNWQWQYRGAQLCNEPSPPDEIVVGIIREQDGVVEARGLLSADPNRGKTVISETGLTGSGTLVLQGLDGFPAILPEGCQPPPAGTPATSTAAGPPPSTSVATTPPASPPPTSNPASPAPAPPPRHSNDPAPCGNSGGNSAQSFSSAQGNGPISTFASSSVSGGDGCSGGGNATANSGSTLGNGGTTQSGASVTNGQNNTYSAASKGAGNTGATATLNGAGGSAYSYGAQQVDFSSVDAWLP